MSNYLDSLVDPDNGLISRSIHSDLEIYQQELGRSSRGAGCFCATKRRYRTRAIS